MGLLIEVRLEKSSLEDSIDESGWFKRISLKLLMLFKESCKVLNLVTNSNSLLKVDQSSTKSLRMLVSSDPRDSIPWMTFPSRTTLCVLESYGLHVG